MGEGDTTVLFERIALIGFGLIGSSLARVVRRDGLARHIAVSARTRRTLDTAVELGLADSVSLDCRDAEAADAFLKGRGIIARRMGVYGLPDCLRVTIGREDEMGAFVETLGAFIG